MTASFKSRWLCVWVACMGSLAFAAPTNKSLIINDAYIKANGTVISGHFRSTVEEPAIQIYTSSPVTITGSIIEGPGILIKGNNLDLTLINTVGIGTNPNMKNIQQGYFLSIGSVKSLRMEGCKVQGTRGVALAGYGGDKSIKNTIKIINNQFYDLEGRSSNGEGGYLPGNFASAAVGLVGIYDIPDIEISGNEIINGSNSYSFSLIDLLRTRGTPESHIRIHDNYLQGAYGPNGAIAIRNASNDPLTLSSGFVDVYNNHVVRATQIGIRLTGGHDVNVFNNRILNSGYSEENVFIAGYSAAVGLVNRNENQLPTVFYNNHAHDNLVGYFNWLARSDWDLSGQMNNEENNQHWQPVDNLNPTLDDEINELKLWKQQRAE